MKKPIASIAFALAALILNPMVACQDSSSSGEDQYNFSESEMRSTVAGTYSGTVQTTGESVVVIVTQTPAPGTSTTQAARSPQCGTRSFVQPAAACVVSTTMAITAHVSSPNASLGETDLKGSFDVYGAELTYGTLALNVTSGGRLSATYDDSTKGFGDWTFTDATGTLLLKLTKQ
jgi:hypothetical protein